MSVRIVRRTGLVVLGLMVGGAATAQAGALNPLAFQPLAASFPDTGGVYTIDTSGSTPTLTGPGGTFSGVLSPDGSTAVFDFGSINIGAAESIGVYGSRPVALLSQQGMTVAGTIDGSGGFANQLVSLGTPMVGGPGGANAGAGPGAGNLGANAFIPVPGAPGYGSNLFGGGGGGAFGGNGGGGAGQSALPNTPGYAAGGSGGTAYGNVLNVLQGGSGGALAAGGGSQPIFQGGGGGGGAIELGAVKSVTISGTVRVDGADAGTTNYYLGYAGGGGSGGAILIAAPSATLTGTLSAAGGAGGASYFLNGGPVVELYGAGGGGGGGVVAIDLTTSGGSFLDQGGTINLAGGAGGYGYQYGPAGSDGAVGTLSIVPEPSGLVLAGMGLLVALSYGRHVRRRRPRRS